MLSCTGTHQTERDDSKEIGMIPRIIHYCWFGRNPLPKSAVKCIDSWRKFFPDYEIKEWNEDNYNVNAIRYTREAYAAKKYAFVSDYARFDILYREGGVYFDTDVEVIRPMDDILALGAFMGMERDYDGDFTVAPGLGLGVNPGLGLYRDILDKYSGMSFVKPDGTFNMTPIDRHITPVLIAHGLKPGPGILEVEGVRIYPTEYFNPKGVDDGRIRLTSNTRTIHHFADSWHTPKERLVACIKRRFGVRASQVASLVMHNPLYVLRRLRTYTLTGK